MFEKKTISDYIYEAIKESIISLEYAPGEKLSEVIISQKFNVSRSPVRLAFGKLEKEGLVTIMPQLGTIVSSISRKKAADICDVRILLEPYAAKIAAEKISDEELKKLKNKFEKLKNVETDTDEKRQCVFRVDLYLHNLILKICNNEEITRILENFRPEIQRIRRSTAKWDNRLPFSEKEMYEIYHAITERNPEKAYEAMQIHVQNIKESIIKLLK